MTDLLEHVPETRHDIFRELLGFIDAFCEEHLNDEYKLVCSQMAVGLCQEDCPILTGRRSKSARAGVKSKARAHGEAKAKGKLAGWAAGVVYSVGWVNFLGDPGQTPHMRTEDIAKGFGVSPATLMNRSRDIRRGFDLVPFDPDFALPSKLDDNPLVWMLRLKDGPIVDVRCAPREFQEAAFAQGLIPYVPADRGVGSQTPAMRVVPQPRLGLASDAVRRPRVGR